MPTEELKKIEEDAKKVALNLSASETVLQNIKNKESEADGVVISIRNKETSLQGEIEKKQRSVESKLTETEETLTKAKSTEVEIGTLKTDAQTKVSEIEAVRTKAEELGKKIEDPSTGVESIMVKIDSDNKVTSSRVEEAETYVTKISKLYESVEKMETEVKTKNELIEGYKKNIEQSYSYINGAGLSHSFSERKIELEKRVIFWQRMTIGSVIFFTAILAGILYFNFETLFSVGFDRFLYKITFSSPGIFAVWFSALQYSRAQKLLESYAFKAATAKALENYTEALENRFGDDSKPEILSFVLSSMQSIYKHPTNDALMTEEKAMEENSLEHITSALKNVDEKIMSTVTSIATKINSTTK